MEDNRSTDAVTLMAVGDIMTGAAYFHSLANESIPDKLDESPRAIVSNRVVDVLANSDLLFGNLECVISEDLDRSAGSVPQRIMGPVDTIELLLYCGFDVVNIANNHILDHGPEYVEETMSRLSSNDIHFVGNPLNPSDPITIRKNGQDITFAGHYLPKQDLEFGIENVYQTVEEMQRIEGTSVLSLHWTGSVHMLEPSPDQVQIGRELIDRGADIVLGHHSHTFQPVERYNDGIIAYSLGNFIFDMWRTENRESGILKLEIREDGEISANVIPIEQIEYQVRLGESDRIRDSVTDEVSTTVSMDEYLKKRSHIMRNHQHDVIRQYARNFHQFPLDFHVSTFRRWTNKLAKKISK